MTPGTAAWIGVGVGVLVYNILAPDGHTLSEEVDRWLDRNEFVVRLAVGIVAHHLTNDLPPAVDPLAWVFLVARWRRRRADAG